MIQLLVERHSVRGKMYTYRFIVDRPRQIGRRFGAVRGAVASEDVPGLVPSVNATDGRFVEGWFCKIKEKK
jgi:hypothetical protein